MEVENQNGYVEAFKAIESTFTEAIVISDGSKINQNMCLYFLQWK